MEKLDKAYTLAYKIGKNDLSNHKRQKILSQHSPYYNACKALTKINIYLFKELERMMP
jgi:hypothetical protein